MSFTKTMMALAVGSVGIMGAMSAQAVAIAPGSILSINAGIATFDSYGNVTNVTSGSFFGMDQDGNSKIGGVEKVPLAMGSTGLVIGTTTSPGASHSGAPTGGDTNAITAPWGFFGNTGSDYLTVAATGSTEAGLTFSGWTVTWNGIAAIPMGAGAWTPGNCSLIGCSGQTFSNGVANFVWDGTIGGAYQLTYTARVPTGDASGFGGVGYYLYLEGNVTAAPVPEAETYAMMLAGLGLIGMMVRRRRSTI